MPGFSLGPFTPAGGEIAGWRAPVFELGVLGILCAGAFAWLAEERAAPNAIIAKETSSEKLFPTPALWLFFIASSVAFSLRDFAGGGMGSLSSLFLQRAHGFSPRMTGLALAGIFLASAISNPLFGGLSDRGRIRWTCSVLLLAAGMMAIFPRLPEPGLIPALVIYGFFFLASYPMVEAAIMESVPDAVRGRVFGLFITVGGLVGNLAHWMAGNWVRRLGDGASLPNRYYALYGFLSVLVILALAGLPCLHAIRKREHLEPAPAGAATSASWRGRNPPARYADQIFGAAGTIPRKATADAVANEKALDETAAEHGPVHRSRQSARHARHRRVAGEVAVGDPGALLARPVVPEV